VDLQQSEAPDWVQEGEEDEETTWFFAAASGRYSYVENVSEAVARTMRKHNVPVAMKPYKTLKLLIKTSFFNKIVGGLLRLAL